jgi:hypothetical protein
MHTRYRGFFLNKNCNIGIELEIDAIIYFDVWMIIVIEAPLSCGIQMGKEFNSNLDMSGKCIVHWMIAY